MFLCGSVALDHEIVLVIFFLSGSMELPVGWPENIWSAINLVQQLMFTEYQRIQKMLTKISLGCNTHL